MKVAINTFGPIDFVVAVAGGSDPSVPATCGATTLDHLKTLFNKNVATTAHIIAAAAPALKAGTGRRDIITFSTTNASDGWGWAGEPALAAAKAAVECLTRSWASELRADGIAVNCIRPASIPNPHSPVWAARLGEPGVLKRMRELYGIHGPLTAEQIAIEVANLLNRDAAFRTGQVITLDAGIGVLGLESPRADGAWWLPIAPVMANNGNGRSWIKRVVARLNAFIAGLLP